MFTYHYLTMLDRQHGCDMGAAYLELSMQLSVAVVKSVTEPGAVSGVERSLSCLVSSSHVVVMRRRRRRGEEIAFVYGTKGA